MSRLSPTPASDAGHPRPPSRRRVGGTRRQHGAVAILAAIFLGLAIVALGALDVGNVYFARRQLQRTADLAALAAVQVISTPGACGSANSTALSNAATNGFTVTGANAKTNTLTTTCGRWSTSASPNFSQSGTPLNAVQVQVTQVVPYFFVGPSRTVTATATAQASNIDQFQLGTGIATVNTQQSALLNAILGGLLNSQVALTVGNTQSLAAANIKLGDLMTALNAGSMQALLASSVTYHDFVAAMANVLRSGGDTVNAALLDALTVNIPGGQKINLTNSATSPGLLSLGLSNPTSAATATVNVLNTVLAAAQIAQSNPNGTAPVINVTAGLTGIAGITLQVINPPVVAIGEGGVTPPVQASTAVANLTITLLPVGLPALNLIVASVSAISTPMVVSLKVAGGLATLAAIDCENTMAATTATIKVTPSITSVCLASNASCSGSINIASISVLGINVATLALSSTGWLSLSPGPTTLYFNGSSGSFNTSQTVNSNAVGSDVGNLTGTLLAALPSALQVTVLGSNLLGDILSTVLSGVTGALTPVLTPIFSLLDSVLVPVLSLLGVQVGTATVNNMALTCGVPQLVQ
jgi:uncharacterized membrane protein